MRLPTGNQPAEHPNTTHVSSFLVILKVLSKLLDSQGSKICKLTLMGLQFHE
jgi:hypothetical protein